MQYFTKFHVYICMCKYIYIYTHTHTYSPKLLDPYVDKKFSGNENNQSHLSHIKVFVTLLKSMQETVILEHKSFSWSDFVYFPQHYWSHHLQWQDIAVMTRSLKIASLTSVPVSPLLIPQMESKTEATSFLSGNQIAFQHTLSPHLHFLC